MDYKFSGDQRDVIINALEKYLDVFPDTNDAGVIVNLLAYFRNE